MYEALIFEGGGIKGMCYIGALPEDKLESFNFKLSKHDLDYLKLVGKNSVQSIF